jgi:hypothetical protein
VNSFQVTTLEPNPGDNELSVQVTTLEPHEKIKNYPENNEFTKIDVNSRQVTTLKPIEKIKNYLGDNELTQDENEAKVIKIVCSIGFFIVLTITIGLLIFCLRGKEKKPDGMEMNKIETGNSSDTTLE